jgi:hypothetical protein
LRGNPLRRRRGPRPGLRHRLGVVVVPLEGEVDCQGRLVSQRNVAAKVNTGTAEIQPGARVTAICRSARDRRWPWSSYQNSAMLLQADPARRAASPPRWARGGTRGAGAPSMPVLTTDVSILTQRQERACAKASLTLICRAILSERARRSLQRLTRNGKRTGRPRVSDREGFQERFTSVLERLKRGELSHRGAARELSIAHATLLRLLRQRRLT